MKKGITIRVKESCSGRWFDIKVANIQKCPKCGVETGVREIAKDMELAIVTANVMMGFGEPEVQCPACGEWFCLQSKEQK